MERGRGSEPWKFQRDIILGVRLAIASPEGVEESVEEEEVLSGWSGISGGLVKL